MCHPIHTMEKKEKKITPQQLSKSNYNLCKMLQSEIDCHKNTIYHGRLTESMMEFSTD